MIMFMLIILVIAYLQFMGASGRRTGEKMAQVPTRRVAVRQARLAPARGYDIGNTVDEPIGWTALDDHQLNRLLDESSP